MKTFKISKRDNQTGKFTVDLIDAKNAYKAKLLFTQKYDCLLSDIYECRNIKF